MTDIALTWDATQWSGDAALIAGDLATDDGLRSAMIISLFTDARARPDDELPQAGADPRGWWGDCGNADPIDRMGSRLWLLDRAKLTPAVALRARDIVLEALNWLLSDGVVRELTIETAILPVGPSRGSGALAITAIVTRPEGPARQRYDFVWEATARSIDRS